MMWPGPLLEAITRAGIDPDDVFWRQWDSPSQVFTVRYCKDWRSSDDVPRVTRSRSFAL